MNAVHSRSSYRRPIRTQAYCEDEVGGKEKGSSFKCCTTWGSGRLPDSRPISSTKHRKNPSVPQNRLKTQTTPRKPAASLSVHQSRRLLGGQLSGLVLPAGCVWHWCCRCYSIPGPRACFPVTWLPGPASPRVLWAARLCCRSQTERGASLGLSSGELSGCKFLCTPEWSSSPSQCRPSCRLAWRASLQRSPCPGHHVHI